MTEKQLERGQAISKEIKYLDDLLFKWENITVISRITVEYHYTDNSWPASEKRIMTNYIDVSKFQKEMLFTLKNRLKELQDKFNNL